MLEFLKKNIGPIGVDIGSGHLKVAQLANNGQGLVLNDAQTEPVPEGIQADSAEWQRWAAKMIKKLFGKGNFKGRQVITAMSAADLFIDQIRLPKTSEHEAEKQVLAKVQDKLPFEAASAMIKFVIADIPSGNGEMDVLVMAANRTNVDHNLAIYERAGLEIRGMAVWPVAMVSSYTRFFGRREGDLDSNVLLVEVGAGHSRIVITRHANLLFARSVKIGFADLQSQERLTQLVDEIEACCRYFESHFSGHKLARLILLGSIGVENPICQEVAALARRLQIPAQIGDVLTALSNSPAQKELGIERRESPVNWATAFGLSLIGGRKAGS